MSLIEEKLDINTTDGVLYYNALYKKYEGEIATARAVLNTYFNKSVGIGEHSDLLDEFDKHLEILANAQDKLNTLKENFDIVITGNSLKS